ncbi:helix-turn-helix transcriptional regulator [Candidatus Avelusimicrobium aviculae]|uniref:helix-turn-helix transcriptional regulator n=1 Tax=Candidatus Avelusimicrobium aviculae TaxID=3416206 RepID=UPI003D132FDD
MKEKTLNKLTRTIYLLNVLDGGNIDIPREAEELGVTVRTIQRDILNLEAAGIPLYKVKPGTYSFTEGFSLKKLQLSKEELSALVLLLELARPFGAKFENVISHLNQRLMRPLENAPYYFQISATPYAKSPITQALEQAVTTHTAVYLTFAADPSKKLNYYLEPLKLVYSNGFWYILGLNSRKQIKTLRLDRILDIRNTQERFTPSKTALNALKSSTNVFFNEQTQKRVVLAIKADIAPYFEKRDYFPRQKIITKAKDGSITLETTISQDEEVLLPLMPWLPNIRIVEPLSLKHTLHGMLQKYLQQN